MDFVKLTHENIENEHICCAIANNKDIQVMSKKNWLKDIGYQLMYTDYPGKFLQERPTIYGEVLREL